jgi:hypothetical protein
MNKKDVIGRLEDLKQLSDSTEEQAALDFAIKAVRLLPDLKALGAKGGRATLAKYGKRQMKKWAKLGGRPRTKAADGH